MPAKEIDLDALYSSAHVADAPATGKQRAVEVKITNGPTVVSVEGFVWEVVMEEDVALISDLINGTKGAPERFLNRLGGFIKATIINLRQFSNSEEKDLFHDAVAHIWKSNFRVLRQWNQSAQLTTYLYPVVRRNAIRTFNRHYRRREDLDRDFVDLGAVDATPSSEDKAHVKLLSGILNEAVERLNKNYKTVIRLYYFEHLSQQQIAKRLRITPRNAGVRLYRAQKRLKALFFEELDS